VLPYSPLAKGFLTGKYTRSAKTQSARAASVKPYLTDDGFAVVDALRDIASVHAVTPAAVALAWSLAQPGITAVIVGANTPAQLSDQLPAASLQLSPEELARLDTVSRPFLDNWVRTPGR
jgi:aryl-alcohol dehydrogenase-like predicted oxidoreductase